MLSLLKWFVQIDIYFGFNDYNIVVWEKLCDFLSETSKKVEIEDKNFLVALVNLFCLFNLNDFKGGCFSL